MECSVIILLKIEWDNVFCGVFITIKKRLVRLDLSKSNSNIHNSKSQFVPKYKSVDMEMSRTNVLVKALNKLESNMSLNSVCWCLIVFKNT